MMTTENMHQFWNIRNVLALLFTGILGGLIWTHVYVKGVKIPEVILGATLAQITLIVQFYFRKAGSTP